MMLRNLNFQFKSVTVTKITDSIVYPLQWYKETRRDGVVYKAEFTAEGEYKHSSRGLFEEGEDVTQAILSAINPTSKVQGAFKNKKAADMMLKPDCFKTEKKPGTDKTFYFILPEEIINELVTYKNALPGISKLFSCSCFKAKTQNQISLEVSLIERSKP